MTANRNEQIRQRAHEIWEREGSRKGREQEFWRQAEEEINLEGPDDSSRLQVDVRRP